MKPNSAQGNVGEATHSLVPTISVLDDTLGSRVPGSRSASRIDGQPSGPLRGILRLNDDVLDLVFKEFILCRILDNYDKNYAAEAFVLAAVCRQWRTTALSSSLLWTHLVLPCGDTDVDCSYYSQIVLERSHEQTLHILLYDCDAESLTRHSKTLDLVIACAPRWRSFNIWGKPFDWPHWRAILDVETPELEFLVINGKFPGDDERDPRWRPENETFDFLPSAPKMRSLEISWIPFLSSHVSPRLLDPQARWSAPSGITQLRLFLIHVQAERLHDVLRATPALVELQVAVVKLGVNLLQMAFGSGSHTDYDLPALRSLDVRGIASVLFARASPVLRMRKLQEVALQPEGVQLMALFFKSREMSQLSTVTIANGEDKLTTAVLLDLQCLKHVSTLAIDCELEDTFWENLTSNIDILWPKLRALHFDRQVTGASIIDMRSQMLNFIRAKKVQHTRDFNISEITHACMNDAGAMNTDVLKYLHEDWAQALSFEEVD